MIEIQEEVRRHKRNRWICTGVLLFTMLAQMGIGIAAGYYRLVPDKQTMAGIQVLLNALFSLPLVVVFVWYAYTLEYMSRWWILPAVIVTGALSIVFLQLPWIILLGIFVRRGRKLIARYKASST